MSKNYFSVVNYKLNYIISLLKNRVGDFQLNVCLHHNIPNQLVYIIVQFSSVQFSSVQFSLVSSVQLFYYWLVATSV